MPLRPLPLAAVLGLFAPVAVPEVHAAPPVQTAPAGEAPAAGEAGHRGFGYQGFGPRIGGMPIPVSRTVISSPSPTAAHATRTWPCVV